MKCPHCLSLNCDGDAVCVSCHASLAPARQQAAHERAVAQTPQWAYLFAALCGSIPVATLGGAIPVGIGLGGAFACLGTARAEGVPLALRLVACVAITAACWAVIITLAVTLAPQLKDNFLKMINE